MKTTSEVFYNNFGDIFLDALDSDVPPEEIYNQIKKVVEENYYYHKHLCSRAYEFLVLLNDNDQIEGHQDTVREREYYEGSSNDSVVMPPWGHSDLEYLSTNLPPTASKGWDGFWEENYYPEENKKTYDEMISNGWTMTADGFWIKDDTQSTNKWTLPVELDGLTGDCLVTLPDDLLNKVGWKENDELEWIDRGDGSFELRKV